MKRDGGAVNNAMNNIDQAYAESFYEPLPKPKLVDDNAARIQAALAATAAANPPNDSPNGLQPGSNVGGFDGFSGGRG
jgi:hypothetical protein